MQTPVIPAVEVPKHMFQNNHILITQVVIVPAENSDGIGDVRPSGSHRVHKLSDDGLLYDHIEGFFVVLPHVKLYCQWFRDLSGLVHAEHRNHHPNVAVLMDDDENLPIRFNVHAEIAGKTPEIIHS
jgi:hypothetical protein